MSDAAITGAMAFRVRPDRWRLFDVAAGQGGYFTAEQAAKCGFSRALLAYHAKSGGFARVQRGLYRFREYPTSPRDDVLASWLAVGKDTAVVSHDSAMDLLDLSDVLPNGVHVTVPRSRRNLPSVSGVKIHTTSRTLRPEDVVVRNGISVTSAMRSILDAAEAGMSPEQIEMAVRQAVERGLTTAAGLELGAAERGRRVALLISKALRERRVELVE